MKNLITSLLLILLTSIFVSAQTPTDTTRKAAELLSRNDIKGANKILDDAIAERKDLLEAYKMRSFVRMLNKNLRGAVEDLTEAIRIKPDDPELYARRAEIKAFQRDDSALDDYSFAISNGYKTEKVYLGRAMLNRNRGKLDEAIADHRTAFALNPDSPNAVVGLASVLEQKGEIDESISILQEFINKVELSSDSKTSKVKIKPTGNSTTIEDVEGGYGMELTDVYIVDNSSNDKNSPQNNTSEMENKLNIAMAYANLAQMQLKKGSLDTALENIQKSITINDSDGYSIGIRGAIYLEKRELENALADFDRSIKLMEFLPNHYIDRGITYLLLGNKDKAQKDFETYLQKNPLGKKNLDKRIDEAKKSLTPDN